MAYTKTASSDLMCRFTHGALHQLCLLTPVAVFGTGHVSLDGYDYLSVNFSGFYQQRGKPLKIATIQLGVLV